MCHIVLPRRYQYLTGDRVACAAALEVARHVTFARVAVGRRRKELRGREGVFLDPRLRAVERGNRMVPHWLGHKAAR